MMPNLLEPLALPFMQRALIAGPIVGLIAGYFGPFVVQRRIAFMGSGLAHAAFGGAAVGLFLGLSATGALWFAIPATVLVAAAIVWLSRNSTLAADTSIGILFSVAMAIGIIALGARDTYAQDAFSLLFGSLLAVTRSDLLLLVLAVALLCVTLPLWSRWAYATFDAELAQTDQVRVSRDDYLLAMTLAVAIVLTLKIVGIILTGAFFVIPAAASRLISRSFAGMTVASIVLGMATALVGTYAAYFLDTPPGPTIILLQAGVMVGVMAFRKR